MINNALWGLSQYAMDTGLIQPDDRIWAINSLMDLLSCDQFTPPERYEATPLEALLATLLDYAVAQGIIENDITSRDLFDTKLMGALTPPPSSINSAFWHLYQQDAKVATDWYYQLSQNTDYIRRYRIAKDQKWVTATPYGDLDITINLSKPEKDPKAIAAAKLAPQGGYPQCMLCKENEGYGGRINHPARQNHRIIPLTIDNQPWFFQYSPYVYYNEHCILLSGEHTPMSVNRSTFRKLLDFVGQFPHYFVGSNADLPIVGGSILSHDHFQGGHYTFAMEKAPISHPITFPSYPQVSGGIVQWPMSVLRLSCKDPQQLVDLADHILATWREYSDPDAMIFAHTEDTPHNTITPIARMRGNAFELDLVLRNNLTTEEHPMGLYHPHQELHHIKKENIGLIEVMGLAVLPARLKSEMAQLAQVLVDGGNPTDHEALVKHVHWAKELKTRYTFTSDNVHTILEEEIGKIFATVLEHAGVYQCTPEGLSGFMSFVDAVNAK